MKTAGRPTKRQYFPMEMGVFGTQNKRVMVVKEKMTVLDVSVKSHIVDVRWAGSKTFTAYTTAATTSQHVVVIGQSVVPGPVSRAEQWSPLLRSYLYCATNEGSSSLPERPHGLLLSGGRNRAGGGGGHSTWQTALCCLRDG